MKVSVSVTLTMVATMLFFNVTAQNIANSKIESVKIYGNCGMCEKTIEKAAFQKGKAKADWNKDTKIAQLTFDSTQTTAAEILQRIAAAGYDSEKYRAPDAVYANLHGCCQYDRPQKIGDAALPVIHDVAPPAAPVKHANPKAGVIKKTATPQPSPDKATGGSKN
jgi:copper chaperone CopZ